MIEALISFLNAQAAQLNFFVGSHVWVEDPDVAWIDGEILESKDQEITISNESGTKVSLLESICISLHVILDFVYITLFCLDSK
jgi:hypothetical protein